MYSYQGHFLVAAPHQRDPNFARAVVLLVEHSDHGAFGVIVNEICPPRSRPRPKRRRSRVAKIAHSYGGPVTGPLMAVHMNPYLGERQFLPGLYFSARESNVLRLMRLARQPCKIFTGYVGWGPRQLDQEVEQGIWRLVLATPEQIFSADDDLWERLFRQVSRYQMRIMFNLRHVPEDPLLN